MQSLEERETAGFKFCHACGSELRRNGDNFCRRCGARQNYDTARLYHPQLNSPLAPQAICPSEITAFRTTPANGAARWPVRS